MKSVEIKLIRKKLDQTQAEFAQTVGTTVTTVSRWEGGQSKPSPVFRKILSGLANKA